MDFNGLKVRDIEPAPDFDPSALSPAFVHSDHFGSMYLPHGGLLAAIQNRMHNLFAEAPEIGRHHRPLSKRDVLMVLGERVSAVSFSDEMHMHLPRWHSTKWSEFVTTPEMALVADRELPAELALAAWDQHLKKEWGFVNPITFLIPAVYYGQRNTPEARVAAASVYTIAFELFNREKTRVQATRHSADRSTPVEITDSLSRFRSDYSLTRRTAFIMMQFGASPAHTQIADAIKDALAAHGITALRADDKQYHDDVWWNVLTYAHGCEFGVAVFERIEQDAYNPNVALEVGYMQGLSKHVCLLKDRTLKTLQTDLIGKLYKEFEPQNPAGTIPPVLDKWLADKGLLALDA